MQKDAEMQTLRRTLVYACWQENIREHLGQNLTSPASGGLSVGIVRSRTQATEFSL
jgi:hypothetical protein